MIRRAALTLLLALTGCSPVALLEEPSPAPAACEEDEACWDWRTMGNRCGRDGPPDPVRCYP